MFFIKLTEIKNMNEGSREIWIDPEKIEYFFVGSSSFSGETLIRLISDNTIRVVETPQQILALIPSVVR